MGKIAFYCENHTKYIDVCTVGKKYRGVSILELVVHIVARG